MKTPFLTIFLISALFAIFSQAAFLPSHQKHGRANKFLDDCIQWGMETYSKTWDALTYENPENIVPTYNVTALVVNYSYEMDQGPPCANIWNVTLSVYCPYVGEKQILDDSIGPFYKHK